MTVFVESKVGAAIGMVVKAAGSGDQAEIN
jgi:hypothetical protein